MKSRLCFRRLAFFELKRAIWLGAAYMFETTQAHRHWLVARMLHYNISWTMILNVNSIDRHSSVIWCGYLLFTLFQCIVNVSIRLRGYIYIYVNISIWSCAGLAKLKDNKFCDCSSGTMSKRSRCVLLWDYVPHLICVTCDFSGYKLTYTYCNVLCSAAVRFANYYFFF